MTPNEDLDSSTDEGESKVARQMCICPGTQLSGGGVNRKGCGIPQAGMARQQEQLEQWDIGMNQD